MKSERGLVQKSADPLPSKRTVPQASPARSTPHSPTLQALDLQHTVGNQAVQRMLARQAIQAKLNVGPAHDRYEQEADAISQEVARPGRPVGAGPARPIRAISALAQRQSEPQSESGETEASQHLETQLAHSQSQGQPLAERTRQYMETRFGSDFGKVRVHTGPQAAQINRQINAQAFTKGSDIYFNAGRYNPGSTPGRQLLAHELTHVVQQGATAQRLVQRKGEAGPVSARTDEQLQESANAMLTPDRQTAELADAAPTRHVFTIGAWRQNNDLLDFIKLRAKSTFRNKLRSAFKWMPGVRKAKTAAETKMATAKRIIKARPGGGELPNHQLIDQARRLANQSNSVGHSWIKLTTYVGDQMQKTSSFGLWPEVQVARPDQSVPGVIKHPDPHRDEPGARMKDYNISGETYTKIVGRVQQLIKGRVPYNIKTSNCTTFARDMAALAGQQFPSEATVIPYGPFGMFKEQLYNPNQLHGDMGGKEGVYENP